MIALLIAIQLVQAPPVTRPAPRLHQPRITDIAPLTVRKHQLLSEASALIARAEADRDKAGAPGGPTEAEFDAMLSDAKAQIDSISEMGEMESLRLQMAMDRLSKMMSTLSNILKKISDTSSSITQNLK